MWNYVDSTELYHHGVKGMRWGVRRYQNNDGSLTPAGKKKYGKYERKIKEYNDWNNTYNKSIERGRANARSAIGKSYDRLIYKYDEKIKYGNNSDKKTKKLMAKRERLKNEQQARLKDHDEGTAYIKEAMKKRNENYTKVWEYKMKALYDPSIKKSAEYKQAKRYFERQLRSDAYSGVDYSILAESSAVAKGREFIRR